MKTVGIIILNYKKWDDTIECLESVFKTTYKNKKIFIVDNNSGNDSLKNIAKSLKLKNNIELDKKENLLVSKEKDIFLIQSFENKGYATGNNIGIKIAIENNCDYILILNPDTTVNNTFLEPLVKQLSFNEEIAMCGPKIQVQDSDKIDYVCARKKPYLKDYFILTYILRYFFKNYKYSKRNPILYHVDTYDGGPKEVDIISGACMLIKSEIFVKINFFDENTFLYLEELILHEKLIKENLKTFIVPESLIFHKQGSSTSLDSLLFIRKEYLKSLNYYLKNYRDFNKFTVKFILLNVFLFQTFSIFRNKLKNFRNKNKCS